jgi:protein-S-isoprenylcysteine O-methyltransferase Ste14
MMPSLYDGAGMFFRHLLSVGILPFTVTVLVPWWIGRRTGASLAVGSDALAVALQLAGLVALGVGLALFAASLRQFAERGRGTLAPWDPPKHLVIDGPYRYVRNPMISGVVFVVFGEAMLLLSYAHLAWALLFLLLNMVFIPLLEEPELEGRFGEPYREYCRHVSRIIPRLQPWTGAEQGKR